MRKTVKVALVGTAVVAAAAVTTGIAVAGSDDDATEIPITGDALQKAQAAALEHTGGGRVTETEVGDEESRYEVEVTLDNGDQLEVQLDQNFHVVGSEGDSEDEGE